VPGNRTSLAIVCAVVFVAALATLLTVALAGSHESRQAAAAHPKKASCAKTLIRDWSDGRIDDTYSVACYRAALRSLPADLRVYSSAPDDIRQAMSARIVEGVQKISAHHGATSDRHIASARSSIP
jgi:hypothetical protein